MYIGHKNAIKADLTGTENLRIACQLDGVPVTEKQAWDALEQLGLRGHEDLPVRVLSQGQKKRVALARLLLSNSPLWILGEPVIVVIKKMKFQPQEVTIKKGGMVRWENRGYRQYHSNWFEQLGEPEPDYLFPGDSYERKFDTVGDFPYRRGPHLEMTGVVHVTD